MTIIPQCFRCVHLAETSMTCPAFPQGIPKVITLNQWDHTKPYPGDHGVRFEPILSTSTAELDSKLMRDFPPE